MEPRPKIELPLSPIDNLLELSGWFALAALWGLLIWHYRYLPATIATHFNASGKADGYGSKTTLFILPSIATAVFILLTILNKFPHVFNYPVKITGENAEYQYTNATRLLRYLKLGVCCLFLIILYKIIQMTGGEEQGLGPWFLVLSLALFLVPIIFFMINSFKKK